MAMTEFERKRKKALALLADTGVWKPNYLPPTFPMLWRVGVPLPPPHFLSFSSLLLVMGLPFGLCWAGLYMMWHDDGRVDWAAGSVGLLLAVLLPGLAFALYYAFGRKRYRLPLWSEL